MTTKQTLRLRYRRAHGAWIAFCRSHNSDHGGAGCTCSACTGKRDESVRLRAALAQAERDCRAAEIDTSRLAAIIPD
jgi:hypothetical protein